MNFDEDISDTVSLSKILDCFIIEEEKPSIIISFLNNYEKDLKEILGNSRYYNRIANLDFYKRCSYNEKISLSKLIDKIVDVKYVYYFVWQILKYDTDETMKSIYRDLIHSHNIKHPYNYGNSHVANIDTFIANNIHDIGQLCDNFNKISVDSFSNIINNMSHSLFCSRIFQVDILNNLDFSHQVVFINQFNNHFKKDTHDSELFRCFNTQVLLDADEIASKKLLLKNIRCHTVVSLNDEVLKIINDSKTSAELFIKLGLMGYESYIESVIYFLLINEKYRHHINYLMENRIDILKEHFDIIEVLDK